MEGLDLIPDDRKPYDMKESSLIVDDRQFEIHDSMLRIS
jgi:hypothetical protein